MSVSRMEENLNNQLEEQLDDISDRIELKGGKYSLRELQTLITEKTKMAARSTDQYVHDNPWQTVGIAAAAGLLLGYLFSRK